MFSPAVLNIDPEVETNRIIEKLRKVVFKVLKKRGGVVAVSGGVDSSVCLALSAKALGKDKVLALLLPEKESSPRSLELGKKVAETVGVEYVVEDITKALEAQGCYQRRDEAIKSVFPEYNSSYKQKIMLPQNILEQDRINYFYIVIESPTGEQKKARLPLNAYLEIVAATNMKQRTRKNMEYYYADKLNYAVIGTPNRLEYDQGFFVKNGDGSADVKPIAHLYKSQVYQLARYLGLPEEVCNSIPTTDTYTLPQTQEEFYFCLPYDKMDLFLYAYDHNIPAEEVGKAMGLSEEQVKRVYRDIETKRKTTRYLHLPPLLLEEVPSIELSKEEAIKEIQ